VRYTFEQLRQLLQSVGFPVDGLDRMAAILLAESGGDPYAYRNCPGDGKCYVRLGGKSMVWDAVPGQGREVSIGLGQVNRRAHPQYPESYLYQPSYNAKAVLDIYRKQGFGAWGSFSNGSYKKYLPGGSDTSASITGFPGGDAGTGGFGAAGLDLFNRVKTWATEPVISSNDRFSPYLKQSRLTSSQRFQIAAIIALVVIAFAWREL